MWQRYIDDALMLTEQITMASIHGLDGVAWANSKELEVVVFCNMCYHGDSNIDYHRLLRTKH